MINKQVFSRGIRSVRNVVYQENSPTHKVGLVIEPGNWEEIDPFLLMAEDFFAARNIWHASASRH